MSGEHIGNTRARLPASGRLRFDLSRPQRSVGGVLERSVRSSAAQVAYNVQSWIVAPSSTARVAAGPREVGDKAELDRVLAKPNTMAIVDVAALAASVVGMLAGVAITATRRLTRSAITPPDDRDRNRQDDAVRPENRRGNPRNVSLDLARATFRLSVEARFPASRSGLGHPVPLPRGGQGSPFASGHGGFSRREGRKSPAPVPRPYQRSGSNNRRWQSRW